MHCPSCKSVSLVMSERSGVEIDYCPQCRGVWLDRGELDKIIERAGNFQAQPLREHQNIDTRRSIPQPIDYDQRHGGGQYKKKKREGFLSEIFDF